MGTILAIIRSLESNGSGHRNLRSDELGSYTVGTADTVALRSRSADDEFEVGRD